jgi:hypothetical protein
LLLRETTGRVVTVVAGGVIGVELLGLWDEVIIEHGEVLADDPFDRDCYERVLRRLGPNVSNSGSTARNTRNFSTLRVVFTDGSELRLAAGEFSTML